MQAVILAAGKSTRTYPLTLTKPKPLLKIANKTLLEHNLDSLNNIVSEVILVVGYKKNMIKKHFKNRYKNLKITYVEQKQQLGTAHAISLVEKRVKNRFLLLMGDDIYPKKDIKKCLKYNFAVLTTRVKDPKNFGVIVEKNNIVKNAVEKPDKLISNLISAGFFTFNKKIFQYIKKIKKSERNELELPDAIKLLIEKESMRIVKTKNWIPIGYPWDLLKADNIIRKKQNKIGKNTKISGKITNSSIGNNCMIKGAVKNSIIMDNAIISENSIIENSIIGENSNFDGKILAKNNAISIVKNKKIKVAKLGAIVADKVKAKDAYLSAGVKIWPNKKISGKIKSDLM